MVAVNSGQSDGEGTVWFDYFQVTQDASGSATSQSASATNGANPSSTNSGGFEPKRKPHTGAIVAIAIVVVVVILAIIAFLWFFRRKRRLDKAALQEEKAGVFEPFRPSTAPTTPSAQPLLNASSNTNFDHNATGPHSPCYPFYPAAPIAPSTEARYTADSPPSTSTASPSGSGFTPPSKFGSRPQLQNGSNVLSYNNTPINATSPSSSSSSANRGSSVAELKQRQSEAVAAHASPSLSQHQGEPPLVQHVDSGIRTVAPDGVLRAGPVELPPAYTPT